MHPDNLCFSDLGFLHQVLVAVDQELGLCPFDVRGQRFKTGMDAVIAIEDSFFINFHTLLKH